MIKRALRSCPLSLSVALLALVLGAPLLFRGDAGAFASLFELRPDALAAGQIWRLLTAHLVHFTPRQWALDLLAFTWLGCACEPKLGRKRYAWLLAVSAVATAVGTTLVEPALGRYRGLSAIATAQLAAVLAVGMREARRSRRLREWIVPVGVAAVLAAKLGYELATGGGSVFGSFADSGVAVCPAAHAIGVAVGGVLAVERSVPSFLLRAGLRRAA